MPTLIMDGEFKNCFDDKFNLNLLCSAKQIALYRITTIKENASKLACNDDEWEELSCDIGLVGHNKSDILWESFSLSLVDDAI